MQNLWCKVTAVPTAVPQKCGFIVACQSFRHLSYEWWTECRFFKDVFQQMLQSRKALAPGSQFKLPHISPEDHHEYHFITNAMHLPAQTIADVYKERWQIELFFKWVKQNLKIKTFLGTSANAVITQVWVALCSYLILALLRFISKTVHSMREILNWIRINLFSNDILDDYLVPKMTEAIANPQLALFWKVVGQQWCTLSLIMSTIIIMRCKF